jgi:hypothetical protein
MNLEKKKAIIVSSLITICITAVLSSLILIDFGPHGEEYKALAEQSLIEAKEEFEKIRGVSVHQVPLVVVNQSWVIENWGVAYTDPDETRVEENIYKALFMISQNTDLYEIKLKWTGMFHAAKWNGKIYIVEEKFDVTNKFSTTSTFVHELTHIMQEDFSLPVRTTFDGSKALSSLKEGDATLMADTYRNDGVVPPQEDVVTSSSSILPESIDKLNRFVYRYGLEFVKFLYNDDDKGWVAVNKAYENPPNTSEQIMHPEKYLNQEDGLPIVAISLNNDSNLTFTDCFGEYFIFVMLDNWLSTNDSELAAEGWGNDIFNYYQIGDDFLFTWDIVWDSNEDAQEFYIAFQNMIDKTSANKITENIFFANDRYLSIVVDENMVRIKSSTDKTLI